MTITPRPNQQKILRYGGGTMGVSAVPGSGKTWTLSCLAASLVAEGSLKDDQELLIVTLVNAAVDNFSKRIARFLTERGLLPNVGYRVCTLHSLAHEIVRSRPSLAGLSDDFDIVDERAAAALHGSVVRAWYRRHGAVLEDYLSKDLSERRRGWVQRERMPEFLERVAANAIKHAKSRGLTAEGLRAKVAASDLPLPLADMAATVYADYQRALAYRGAVDFDDLIRLAGEALDGDPALLKRLRAQWPYVLEDEAQDSSYLQEQILRKIAGPAGNWIRVGDPNQAIYATFTTADPRYLQDFLKSADQPCDLPDSGRSTESIIGTANYLVDWCRENHPEPCARGALSRPKIQPAPAGDPQSNPPDEPERVAVVITAFSEADEIERVVRSVARWVPAHPDRTAAVLVPVHEVGSRVIEALKAHGVPHTDSLLRLSSGTRRAAGALATVLRYLADPVSPKKLARTYRVWSRSLRETEEGRAVADETAQLLLGCSRIEEYLWPRKDGGGLAAVFSAGLRRGDGETVATADLRQGLARVPATADLRQGGDMATAAATPRQSGDTARVSEAAIAELRSFRDCVRRWHRLRTLPIDQLVLALARELFTEPAEIALAHKFAGLLRQAQTHNPGWMLPELTGELVVIAKDRRKFAGLSEDDAGFDPERHRGEVAVATMHAAKGLEWDRVHLVGVNNHHFPSGADGDSFMDERWFIRDGLNLGAETMAQIDAARTGAVYQEGEATREARLEYIRERLRLLYVGITRARRELMITANTGRKKNVPALPLHALAAHLNERRDARTT